MLNKKILFLFIGLLVLSYLATAQKVKIINVDSGWANNSVNTVIFRKNSLVTFRDTQFIAYYDPQRYVVIGKRRTGSDHWQLKKTSYQGNTADAHNMISIMADGAGYLHVAWDHHNNPLRYCRSVSPGSLELTSKLPMTGKAEMRVSYPEFYRMPDGDLLFFYRDGESGQGNLVINRYNRHTQQWTNLSANLVDGEQQRSAYWQACIDERGTIHLSWVWRETPDVASNHDLCYAKSTDGGKTWQRSTGEKYQLPITAATAEYACKIPQKSELINQTSMFADEAGRPYIVTYWRDSGTTVPQYHLVYKTGTNWETQNLAFRHTPFSLSGAGTRRIPISRPQVIAWQQDKKTAAAILFRDEERGGKISVAVNRDIRQPKWEVSDLVNENVGSWEPTYDTELWKKMKIVNIFMEAVEQADGEGQSHIGARMIRILEWKPF